MNVDDPISFYEKVIKWFFHLRKSPFEKNTYITWFSEIKKRTTIIWFIWLHIAHVGGWMVQFPQKSGAQNCLTKCTKILTSQNVQQSFQLPAFLCFSHILSWAHWGYACFYEEILDKLKAAYKFLVKWSPDLASVQTIIDYFTVPLHSPNGRHLPSIRAVQGDCQWHLKISGNSHQSCESIYFDWGNPNLYLNQTVTKGWCQSNDSNPTENPNAMTV